MKPANGQILMDLTERESLMCESILKTQIGLQGTGYVLMKKIVCVLKWKYKRSPKRFQEIIEDVAPAFSERGAELIL